MDVAIAGGHGFIGSALIEDLVDRGHHVRRLVRRESVAGRSLPDDGPGAVAADSSHPGADRPPDGGTGGAPALGAPVDADARGAETVPARGTVRDVVWDPRTGDLDPAALEGTDAVVNLAGAGVGDRRWTAAYRATIRASRTSTSGLIARTIAALDSRPALVQASAVGCYGDRGDEALTERSGPGHDFLAGVVRDWEAAATPAADAGARVVLLRSGIVLAPRGGALGRLLPLVRLGLGGPLGGGRQWWPWITLPDELAVVRRAIGADDGGPALSGPVNAVAPGLVTNAGLTRALAAALHRPAVVPAPAFALRAALGGFADELLASRRLIPAALQAAGFTWRHATPEAAASWIASEFRRS
ncbi:TIGR01777 family oxidoreductase [Myceligenerans pegani]|uniref:TIGR01777 family protein n=1 Tax=Myceligenerans pegani TaxID=2776917 RepID=A0ABR9MY41_9MICO|nr:TIGR01777 family oxidoreductase [Myceligenerans sp. TRM 65318]MBE1875783.1 TIGR01777 family protein [Myceligenerans sp. TRM 65318]MBE3018054.1 TIGR01777 family protein [Myceligenerans sp. TRM 65318]